MSRTLKHLPYKVRARRYGRPETEHTANCGEIHQRVERTTAVFYAHEVREREAYEQKLSEHGFTVSPVECEGFLGSAFPHGAQTSQLRSAVPDFMWKTVTLDELNFSSRRVVSHPQEYSVRIDNLTEDEAEAYRVRYTPNTLITRRRLRHGRAKRNLFVVVTAERTWARDAWCPHGEYDLSVSSPHRGGDGHCCFWCSKVAKHERENTMLEQDMADGIRQAEFGWLDELAERDAAHLDRRDLDEQRDNALVPTEAAAG